MALRIGCRRLRGRGIVPVASRAAPAVPTRPAGNVAGDSVLGGAGRYRVDTAVAFGDRGGRRHRRAYLGDRSISDGTSTIHKILLKINEL